MTDQNGKSGVQAVSDAARAARKAVEIAKAAALAAAGNWLNLVKILVPVIAFIIIAIFLFTFMFAAWLFSPKDNGETSFESPEKVMTEEFKQGIMNAVTDAYAAANNDYIDAINGWYNDAKKSYNGYTELRIENPLESSSMVESEIYKVYAMFSVYKDRLFAIERMKNPNMKMPDESKIYNINDLKSMLRYKYNLLLTCEVNKAESTYQPQKYDEATKQWIDDTDQPLQTNCIFTYKIKVSDVDSVGPTIFGLQDLTNSTDPNIPGEAKIDEIELAKAKTKSIAEIFDNEEGGDIDVYGIGETEQIAVGAADYSAFVDDYTVPNVSFSPYEKVSVPLGAGYHYSGSDTADYGWRIHPIKKVRKFHTGIDIGAPQGTPIYSLASGVVVKTGFSDGYGNYVIVYHGEVNGSHYFSTYNHIMAGGILVQEGQSVTNSTVLGNVGSTGLSTAPHLHFELRVGTEANGTYSFVFKDPVLFLNLN